MKLIERMIEGTIGLEGGYSNNPDDRGGETMWGVTKWVARNNGYLGAMAAMPRDEAVRIYREEYAIKPGFDVVAGVYPKVGAELFDSGVNLGQRWPALWLQMALNAFNQQGKLYPDIGEDGDIGPGTIQALKAFRDARGTEGEEVLLKALNCLQGARYLDLARGRSANESFVYGWLKNRVEL
jgi:lysozyme family protein